MTAKIMQRKLEESQRVPRKGLLLSKCCYCLELSVLSWSITHRHMHRNT